jgi:hypothetical protein
MTRSFSTENLIWHHILSKGNNRCSNLVAPTYASVSVEKGWTYHSRAYRSSRESLGAKVAHLMMSNSIFLRIGNRSTTVLEKNGKIDFYVSNTVSNLNSKLTQWLGNFLKKKFQAKVLDRYPPQDRSYYPFPGESLSLFCFPSGIQFTVE